MEVLTMFGKNRNKKVGICVMVVTASLVLAALWAVLATPETALAKKPITEPILFNVTTLTGSAIEIVGYFDAADPGANEDGIVLGPAKGYASDRHSNVGVRRPSPAIQMDFLAALDCFDSGDIYSFDCSGSLGIFQDNKGAFIRYFFQAYGKDPEGEWTHYRIDADAEIVSDTPGNTFPRGESVDGGYTVTVSNIKLSVDTGSRKNGCKGSFPNASATIRLVRIQ
jgi:hypothetical protein